MDLEDIYIMLGENRRNEMQRLDEARARVVSNTNELTRNSTSELLAGFVRTVEGETTMVETLEQRQERVLQQVSDRAANNELTQNSTSELPAGLMRTVEGETTKLETLAQRQERVLESQRQRLQAQQVYLLERLFAPL